MYEIDSFSYLILDLKRVLQIDKCAVTLLFQTQMQSRRKILLLTHLPDDCSDRLGNEANRSSKRFNTPPVNKIIREGDTADSLYLLAAGRVSICLTINKDS
jgi:CRP-like cAMP-binding protein